MYRSWLFVPGDSERKLTRCLDAGADALIFDLEDSVTPQRKGDARQMVAEFLRAPRAPDGPALYVRINPWGTDMAADDLDAVMAGAPDGIMQPKTQSAQDVIALGAALTAQEDACGGERGTTRILPIVTETPRAVFNLNSYTVGVPRLVGLTWGAEDLGAAIGASDRRDEAGQWLAPFELVRNLTLFAAHGAEVEAIDTLHGDFRDLDALQAHATAARRIGFTGKLAIHPAQVAPINAAMTPGDDEIAHAQRIVEAFEAAPGAGAVSLDGQMLDRPHLRAARRLLAVAPDRR
jgi:citrate lyase subunit beta/citryl-CoA lyase